MAMKPIKEMSRAELAAIDQTKLSGRELLELMRRFDNIIYGEFKMGNEYTGDLTKLNEVATVEGVDGNWVWGKIDGYHFEAKVFATGSSFGIDGGRISKLSIREDDMGDSKRFVNYDRGWDVKPGKEVKATYDKLLEALK